MLLLSARVMLEMTGECFISMDHVLSVLRDELEEMFCNARIGARGGDMAVRNT